MKKQIVDKQKSTLSFDYQRPLYPATMGKYILEKLVQPVWLDDALEFFDSHGRTVPGRGKKTSNKCGGVIGFYQCPQDGYVEEWTHNCSKSTCPICYKNWLKRRTQDSGRRLKQISELLHRAPNHIVLSPPKNFRGSKQEFFKAIKAAGIIGGCKIFHAWRFRSKATGQPIAWKRTDINPNSEEKVPSYGIDAPHWHILGWGYLKNAKLFHQETGWVYKNLGTRNGDHLYRTLYYQLSHATIDARKQSLTWFGIVANNKLVTDVKTEYQAKLCPHCGTEMKKYQYYAWEPIEVENKQKVRMKYYRFKGRTK